ncbi:MAG: glycosyltransferase family 4 protein [Fibrobacter sp.]|nr:glycosyltransferase family 4 protein [Fibrobacter sp.]
MKKKILFIEQNTDGTIGGSHYCLLYLIDGIDKTKYEPIVLFYENHKLIPDFELKGKVHIHNYREYNKNDNKIKRKAINMFVHLKHFVNAFYWISRQKINLIHLNNSILGGYDLWLPISLFLHIPCISHERGFNSFSKLNRVEKYLLNKYSAVISVSDVIRENVKKSGISDHKLLTVHDGIDPDLYRSKVTRRKDEVRRELNINSKVLIIGMIGNIRQIKGQEYLLDVLKIVEENYDDFVCIMVGGMSKSTKKDNEYGSYLIKLINEYGMRDKINLTGFRSDIPDIINIFDVQVNASIIPDAFPHVILEGMSLGKAIVATNLGGAKECIKNGVTGFMVPHDNEKEFANKLLLLLENKKLREKMGKAAKERINEFHIQKNIEKTQLIYSKTIKNNSN